MIPAARMQQLAEYGASKKSSQLRSLYPARKLASLFAIVHTYAAIAVDEFFEMLNLGHRAKLNQINI